MKGKMHGALIGCVLMAVASTQGALASTVEKSEPVSQLPWVRGVPARNRDAASTLLQAANDELRKAKFVDAAKTYRAALEQWDHPAIHYNLALTLVNLDQPVEVYEHLEAAMQYGPMPLEEVRYQYAQESKANFESQIVRLKLTCDTPGATVLLDGKTVLRAPGRYEIRIRPGPHTIVATKAGYLDRDMSRTFVAGESAQLDLKLYTEAQLTRYERRWPTWVPWAVVGSGLAVVGSGGVFHLSTQRQYNLFDQGVAACGTDCKPTPELLRLRSRGDQFRTLSWGAYAAGGGALATGALLLYFNKAHVYRLTPEQVETVSLTPLVGETNGLMATFSF